MKIIKANNGFVVKLKNDLGQTINIFKTKEELMAYLNSYYKWKVD